MNRMSWDSVLGQYVRNEPFWQSFAMGVLTSASVVTLLVLMVTFGRPV